MTETKSLKEITSSLVDHTDDLNKMNEFVIKIKTKYEDDVKKQRITPRKKEIYLYTIEEALGLVGDMSLQMFNAITPLEDVYMKRHVGSPKLGRKLFLEKYEGLHKPYDQVKNRLWKLFLTVKGVKENE